MFSTIIAQIRAYFIQIVICIGICIGGIVVWQLNTNIPQSVPVLTQISWNYVGLDERAPAQGPQHYPIAAQLCNPYDTPIDVQIDFLWQDQRDVYTGDQYINVADCTPVNQRVLALPPDTCEQVTFISEITPDTAAFGATRGYRIRAQSSAFIDDVIYEDTLEVRAMRAVDTIHTTQIAFGAYRNDSDLSQIPDTHFRSTAFGDTQQLTTQTKLLIRTYTDYSDNSYSALQGFVYVDNTRMLLKNISSRMQPQQSAPVSVFGNWYVFDSCNWSNGACAQESTIVGGQLIQTMAIDILPGDMTDGVIHVVQHGVQNNQFVYNSDYETNIVPVTMDGQSGIAGCVGPSTASPTSTRTSTVTPETPIPTKKSATQQVTATRTPSPSVTASPTLTITATWTPTVEPTITAEYTDSSEGERESDDIVLTPTPAPATVTPTVRREEGDSYEGTRPTRRPATATTVPVTATAVPTTAVPPTATVAPPTATTILPTSTTVPPTATINSDDAPPTRTLVP